jgi:Protein of unknown function (DUF5132)
MIGSRTLGAALLVGGGIAAIALALAAPKILRASRPFVRESLKRGMGAYARARAAAAEFAEDMEDLVAEVQAELTRERPPPAPDAEPPIKEVQSN